MTSPRHAFFKIKASMRYTSLCLWGFLAVACTDAPAPPDPNVVSPPGASPLVSAGSNKSVTLPESRVALEGSALNASVQWSQLSGVSKVVFKSASTANTLVMADQVGEYKLRLTAKTAQGTVTSSDMVLTVKPNAVVIGGASTPLDHLKSLTQPVFKQGHTLLPLSKSSCAVAAPINVELMRHWGYSGQFSSGIAQYGISGLLFDEMKASPGRYPLEMSFASFYPIYDNFAGTRPDLPVLPDSAYLRDASGAFILDGQRRISSPAAPDAVLSLIGDHVGKDAAVAETQLNQAIALITNSGEYGLSNFNESNPSTFYEKDPTVVAAHNASGLDWFQYNSREKARHEKLIKDAIFKHLKKGTPVYSAYGEQYGTERGRWFGWKNYISLYEYFIGADGAPLVSDYSSPEMYFSFHNSGWSGIHDGSAVPWDGLTQALKNIGGAIKLGQRNVYPWVSMGWDGGDSGGISDNDLFMGMMKSYYTIGALGAVSGYFTCAGAPFQAMRLNEPVGATVPTQIRGLYLLGQTHALFSHLEEYLRDGDLLTGSGIHPYSDYGQETTPSMEFVAEGETKQVPSTYFGSVTIPTARVLARKIKNQDRWLITAWANTGNDRDIAVVIDPKLGRMTLKARRAGSVYLAELKNAVVSLRLVDEDGMNPTRSLFP